MGRNWRTPHCRGLTGPGALTTLLTRQSLRNRCPLSRFISDKFLPERAKRERRKEARPGELLDAALDLFVEKGFAATRAEEVAARAGVSKGTLFLYFPSKEELFKAVVRREPVRPLHRVERRVRGLRGQHAPTCCATACASGGSAWARPSASGITKLMMSEGRNFPELAEFYQQEVVRPGHTLLRRILRRGIDSGEFAPVDVDHAIYAVIAPMIFLMLWKHSAMHLRRRPVRARPREVPRDRRPRPCCTACACRRRRAHETRCEMGRSSALALVLLAGGVLRALAARKRAAGRGRRGRAGRDGGAARARRRGARRDARAGADAAGLGHAAGGRLGAGQGARAPASWRASRCAKATRSRPAR